MRQFLFFFLFVSIAAHAEWDHLFSEDEDPSLFHHVNVITGNLNLCLQDGVIQGAKSIPLFRTYSSAGALERKSGLDLSLRKLRGLLIQGGWSFFPHANLYITIHHKLSNMQAYLPEKSGNCITYAHPRKGEKSGDRVLTPRLEAGQCSGNLSARTNPQNNLLIVNIWKGTATLLLPDGGRRTYVGEKLGGFIPGNNERHYYRLVSETLPSLHEIHYDYDDKDQLKEISIRNPSGSKKYAWAYIDLFKKKPPYHFQLTTSDGKTIDYQALEFKDRDYLSALKCNFRPEEILRYAPGRKGIGARLEDIVRGGTSQLKISYYLPPDEKTEQKWFYNSDKKGLSADKVYTIEAPFGPNGEMQVLGRFFYCQEFTDVRDTDGILTRYFHDGQKVTKIVNFDKHEALYSSTQFLWEGERLRSKVKLNAAGEPLLAKTFTYDASGNVIEEALWGNLTGKISGRFALGEKFSLSGAESLSKRFSYHPHFNLPASEIEEEGPTTTFFYKPNTDLLTLKLTYNNEKIIKREIFEYDEDHLLLAEIVDDGNSSNPTDLSNATLRQIKRYTIDPTSGLTKTVRELYYDLETRSELLLKRVELSYSPENLVTKEEVYDATNTHRYTLITEYEKGRVVRRTTPLGNENFYRYDSLGNLLESKEPGSPNKVYTYDIVGRPLICCEHSPEGTEKIHKSTYDTKGRLLSQIDTKGNATEQTYDEFGRCLETKFSQVRDEKEEVYSPIAYFNYDIAGNIASTTTARDERTETVYNALRKPVEIRHADGTQLHHIYNKNGTLKETIYPDQTEIHYSYDIFQRMTSKRIFAKSGEELSCESWEYGTFHLRSQTDARGLTTRYAYDGAGRKIAETAEGRKKTFSYDALGFLERITEGDVSHVQICDVEGYVIEEWIEEKTGRTENWMRFSYDSEGRKEKSIRLTSQGNATDLFSYDADGKLTKHTDPEGKISHFLYEETERNDLGQCVQKKTKIDALGNMTIETCDALNRLTLLEKKDPQENVVFREEYLYDRSGNRTKRITSIFQKSRLFKKISASWEYDSMGRVAEEVEDEKKATKFNYDERGRIKTRTLPDGTILSYSYDGIDRLTEQKSSDGTIHLLYSYRKGPDPIEIRDLVNQTKLTRTHNIFGELIEETNSLGLHYKWERDAFGRTTKFTLPDNSSIAYIYAGKHLVSVERRAANDQPLYAHRYTHFDENGHVSEEELIHRCSGARTTRDLLERPISFTSLPLHHRAVYGPTSLVMASKNSLFGEKKYSYDALGQLEQEGSLTHTFDSIGNPIQCEIEICNQISRFADFSLVYDPCGNPRQRVTDSEEVFYTYDALGRLSTITYPRKKEVRYLYDPLSRLLSKKVSTFKNGSWHLQPPIHYLYDQENEIGTLDSKGMIHELKVLGLGIYGEIGAAVAIELDGKAFAPLHDFQGNILALFSPLGEIVESYEITAFGNEKSSSSPINPWRFSSKRAEEGLVFFGQRFYDPSLGRWLTPDPSGFTDGPNLYVFVLNSPLNRLDLFGLNSEFKFPELEINVPMNRLIPPPDHKTLIQCQGRIGQVHVDWVISCEHWHKLEFSAEEHNTGMVNIGDHMHELLPKDGMAVGLITAQNGINTKLDSFAKNMCQSIVNKVPEGPLFLGLHLPSKGIFSDLCKVTGEIFGKETPEVCATSQAVGALIERFHKYDPEGLWLHIAFSRGGGVIKNAITILPPEQKKLLQQHLYLLALGPSQPISRDYGFRVLNIYSSEDGVTGWSGIFPSLYNLFKPTYDISYAHSRATLWDRLTFHSDHAIMRKTYQGEMQDKIHDIRKIHGFYNDTTR